MADFKYGILMATLTLINDEHSSALWINMYSDYGINLEVIFLMESILVSLQIHSEYKGEYGKNSKPPREVPHLK